MPLTPAAGRAVGLAALLTVSGSMHFIAPAPMVAIVPRSLPEPELLVAASGVAELVCAGLLAVPATRRWGGTAAAALFVAVFPANVSMALRSGRKPGWYRVATWLRLPLQAPLIWWATQVARTA